MKACKSTQRGLATYLHCHFTVWKPHTFHFHSFSDVTTILVMNAYPSVFPVVTLTSYLYIIYSHVLYRNVLKVNLHFITKSSNPKLSCLYTDSQSSTKSHCLYKVPLHFQYCRSIHYIPSFHDRNTLQKQLLHKWTLACLSCFTCTIGRVLSSSKFQGSSMQRGWLNHAWTIKALWTLQSLF